MNFSIYIFIKKLFIYITSVNIHHWPHGSSHQDLNLGFQSNKLLPLSSNYFIWLTLDQVMIVFNTLFILNVLQKPTLTILSFSYYVQMKTFKVQSKRFFQDAHIFSIFKKKNYLIWLKMHLNLAIEYISTMVSWIFLPFWTIMIFLIFCPNEKL